MIREVSDIFGAQCVVLCIDYRSNWNHEYRAWIKGGEVKTPLDQVRWVIEGEKQGAGEILLTAIDHDRIRCDSDWETSRKVISVVSIPVILSGGCGLTSHFIEGFIQGKTDGISAGTYF